MPKVVLCGGDLVGVLRSPSGRDVFANRLRSRAALIYPFARNESDWGALLGALQNLAWYDEVEWILASPDSSVRRQQIEAAEMILLFGGDESALLSVVDREELVRILARPWVVGTSAGVNVLSHHYYSNDRRAIFSGTGLLPISTICHYREENHHAYMSLCEQAGTRVIALAERELFILDGPDTAHHGP